MTGGAASSRADLNMTKKKKSGRPSLFGSGQVKDYHVSANISATAGADFEHQRDQLRELYRQVTGETVKRISAADVLEFLARGTEKSRAFFERQHDEEELSTSRR